MDNRGLPPDELKELRRQRKVERIKIKLQLEREIRQKKREANVGKKKNKALAELKAMNNEKPNLSVANQKNKNKTASKGSGTVGTSKVNKKGEQKRKERYNQRVWKGWRESDGKESPVITRRIEDIEEQ